jgi:hypothetical protein
MTVTLVIRSLALASLCSLTLGFAPGPTCRLQPVVSFSTTTTTTAPFSSARIPEVSSSTRTVLSASLSSLPKDISPFEKSSSKSRDVQGEFRKIAEKAVKAAIADGVKQIELEFPPLLGGSSSKSQFDDFDNVQELNENRDWCIQFMVKLDSKPVWFILPDLKEVELAKEEWTGKRYRDAAVWSSIEAVTDHYGEGSYAKPWGATFASGMSSLLGGSKGDAGLLGDQSSLDELEGSAGLHLVCQPGNGGPGMC